MHLTVFCLISQFGQHMLKQTGRRKVLWSGDEPDVPWTFRGALSAFPEQLYLWKDEGFCLNGLSFFFPMQHLITLHPMIMLTICFCTFIIYIVSFVFSKCVFFLSNWMSFSFSSNSPNNFLIIVQSFRGVNARWSNTTQPSNIGFFVQSWQGFLLNMLHIALLACESFSLTTEKSELFLTGGILSCIVYT